MLPASRSHRYEKYLSIIHAFLRTEKYSEYVMSTLLSLTRRVSYLFPGTSKTAFCYLFLWICFKCACWLLPVLLIKRFYICYHQIVALKIHPTPLCQGHCHRHFYCNLPVRKSEEELSICNSAWFF